MCPPKDTHESGHGSFSTLPSETAQVPVRGKTEMCGEERSHRGMLPGTEKGSGLWRQRATQRMLAGGPATRDRSWAPTQHRPNDLVGEARGCRRFSG